MSLIQANFPTPLRDLIATGWCKSYPAVHITLETSEVLKYSTIPLSFGSDDYLPRLIKRGSIRTSLTRSADRCEIQLDNSDSQLGLALVDPTDALRNVMVQVYQIFVNLDDQSESYRIERFFGFLRGDAKPNDEILVGQVMSDIETASEIEPFHISKTCVWRYKDSNCTYSGELPSCKLTFDDCVVHFGLEMAKARFGGGAISLDDNTINEFGSVENFNRFPPPIFKRSK